MDRVGDRAAGDGVAHADEVFDLPLQLIEKRVDRPDAEREHHTVRREADKGVRLFVDGDGAARLDGQQLHAGAELRAGGHEPLHLVVDKLEPGTRRDFVRHFDDGDAVARFV